MLFTINIVKKLNLLVALFVGFLCGLGLEGVVFGQNSSTKKVLEAVPKEDGGVPIKSYYDRFDTSGELPVEYLVVKDKKLFGCFYTLRGRNPNLPGVVAIHTPSNSYSQKLICIKPSLAETLPQVESDNYNIPSSLRSDLRAIFPRIR